MSRTKMIRIPQTLWQDQTAMKELLRPAAETLLNGGLVAFPTETVYGLGGMALSAEAARAIYAAKGRPSDNPLIAHVADSAAARPLVRELPPLALRLMEHFSPGPLTYILPKSPQVPDATSGGLDSIAIRIPCHPVALALLQLCGTAIAAPSANASGRPSPTRADHVRHDLDGRIDMIVDAGPCDFGLESTVLDLCHLERPRILRPGALTAEELIAFLEKQEEFRPLRSDWRNELRGGARTALASGESPRAPGMKYRHYAPSVPVLIISGSSLDEKAQQVAEILAVSGTGRVAAFISESLYQALRSRHIDFGETGQSGDVMPAAERARISLWHLFDSADGGRSAAHDLFHCLRDFDRPEMALILAEAVDERQYGYAYMNRLRKAAGEKKEIRPEDALGRKSVDHSSN